MAKKKIKFVSRHSISLKETRMFSHRVEKEMREEMERGITKAYPNPIDRAHYIADCIRALDKEIAKHKGE